jgi:hypothetical protein
MGFQSGSLDTDSTFMAMSVRSGSADATNAAIGTVILPFLLVVEEDTVWAPVGADNGVAMGACLCSSLLRIAHRAPHGAHGMTIHGVGFFRIFLLFVVHLVMAESAGNIGVAARRQKESFALVVGTTAYRFARNGSSSGAAGISLRHGKITIMYIVISFINFTQVFNKIEDFTGTH